jgi:hypothetical protein
VTKTKTSASAGLSATTSAAAQITGAAARMGGSGLGGVLVGMVGMGLGFAML